MQKQAWQRDCLKALAVDARASGKTKKDAVQHVSFLLAILIQNCKRSGQYETAMWATELHHLCKEAASLNQLGTKWQEVSVKETKSVELTPASNTGVTNSEPEAISNHKELENYVAGKFD